VVFGLRITLKVGNVRWVSTRRTRLWGDAVRQEGDGTYAKFPWVVRRLRVLARVCARRWRITMPGFVAPEGAIRRGWNQDLLMMMDYGSWWIMGHQRIRGAPVGAPKRCWFQVTTDADDDDAGNDDGIWMIQDVAPVGATADANLSHD